MFFTVCMGLILLLRVHLPESLTHSHLEVFSGILQVKRKNNLIVKAQNRDSEY